MSSLNDLPPEPAHYGEPSCECRSFSWAFTPDSMHEIFDKTPIGMLICSPGGQIEYVNKKLNEWFEYGADELIGQDVQLLVPARLRKKIERTLAHAVRNHRTSHSGRWRLATGLHRQGYELPLEFTLLVVQSNGHRKCVAMLNSIVDRQRAEVRENILSAELHRTSQQIARCRANMAETYAAHGDLLQAVISTLQEADQMLMQGAQLLADQVGEDHRRASAIELLESSSLRLATFAGELNRCHPPSLVPETEAPNRVACEHSHSFG